MRTAMRRLVTVLIALDAVLLFWASQAEWGRVEIGNVRYGFGLLGVALMTDVNTANERVVQCGWYDAPPVPKQCERAERAVVPYRLLRLAPIAAAIAVVAFVLAAFAHIRPESGPTGLGPPPFAIASASAVIASLLLLTRNVSSAVAVFSGHEVDMGGSGLNAAWIAVLILLAVAALSPYSTPARTTSD
ncbi:MAG: hypothetical protein ABI969_07225 [bacterium]